LWKLATALPKNKSNFFHSYIYVYIKEKTRVYCSNRHRKVRALRLKFKKLCSSESKITDEKKAQKNIGKPDEKKSHSFLKTKIQEKLKITSKNLIEKEYQVHGKYQLRYFSFQVNYFVYRLRALESYISYYLNRRK